MPDDTDDGELGNAPTTVTSMVEGPKERGATQQIPVDPKWSSEPPSAAATLDQTFPASTQPDPTLKQRVRMLVRSAVHEFRKLPSGTRTGLVAGVSVLCGLIIGLLIAPRGAPSARPGDEDMVKHAKRLSLAERDAVVRALSVGDTTAALMMLRAMGTKDKVSAEPLALALRGRLAIVARDGVDALDSFEAALAADAKLGSEPWLGPAVVQTFASNKIHRTTALLTKLPKEDAVRALEGACMDWQLRVRRNAQDALKNLGGQCPDPVGALMLDAYQAEKCDAARAAAQKLVPLQAADERVGAALDALSRRPSVSSCVAELIPRK